MQSYGKVLNVLELADYLRVSRATIYRLLERKQLPAFRIGSDWRFNVEEIDQWRLAAVGRVNTINQPPPAQVISKRSVDRRRKSV